MEGAPKTFFKDFSSYSHFSFLYSFHVHFHYSLTKAHSRSYSFLYRPYAFKKYTPLAKGEISCYDIF